MKQGSMGGFRRRILGCMGVGGLLIMPSGCGAEAPSEEIAEIDSPIINGTTVTSANAPTNPGTVAVYHGTARPCSGTLVRRQWVLTARHCLTADLSVFGPLLPVSAVKVVRATSPGLQAPPGGSQAVAFIGHNSVNMALIQISPEIAAPVALSNASNSQLPGTTLRAMGFGRFFLGGATTDDDDPAEEIFITLVAGDLQPRRRAPARQGRCRRSRRRCHR